MGLRKADLFTFIHKALRSLLYATSSKIQISDFGNLQLGKELIEYIEQNLILLQDHVRHENKIIFPEVADKEPEMIKALINEHKEIEQMIREIQILLNNISQELDKNKRIILGNNLNGQFNQFTATYLAHMNNEETTILYASIKYLSNDELNSIKSKIQSQIPNDRFRLLLNWMIKSLNDNELVGLLGGMKSATPESVYENVFAAAEEIIDTERWRNVLKKMQN